MYTYYIALMCCCLRSNNMIINVCIHVYIYIYIHTSCIYTLLYKYMYIHTLAFNSIAVLRTHRDDRVARAHGFLTRHEHRERSQQQLQVVQAHLCGSLRPKVWYRLHGERGFSWSGQVEHHGHDEEDRGHMMKGTNWNIPYWCPGASRDPWGVVLFLRSVVLCSALVRKSWTHVARVN